MATRLEDPSADLDLAAELVPETDAAADPLAFLEEACPDLSARSHALCLCIKERFEMPWDDAVQVTRLLADLFDGRLEVDDDELPKDLRAMFYDLQAKDLLRIRREEYRSPEGKNLRAFYWSLDEETLDEVRRRAERAARLRKNGANGNGANGHANGNDQDADVYEALPDNAWARAANGNGNGAAA